MNKPALDYTPSAAAWSILPRSYYIQSICTNAATFILCKHDYKLLIRLFCSVDTPLQHLFVQCSTLFFEYLPNKLVIKLRKVKSGAINFFMFIFNTVLEFRSTLQVKYLLCSRRMLINKTRKPLSLKLTIYLFLLFKKSVGFELC